MIFCSRSDLCFSPRTLADFQVPVTPSLVHGDEIFTRQEKIHDRIKQTLLFPSFLVPVGEIKGAFAPQDPRDLPGPIIFDRFYFSMSANAPAIALERTDERDPHRPTGPPGASLATHEMAGPFEPLKRLRRSD